MRPIRDLAEVRPTNVLYHSAFGFARVRDIEGDHVGLDWESPGENLPSRVSLESLARVYGLCNPDGFFDRALNAADALREQLQVDPLAALYLLLADLEGPQLPRDVREWVVGRALMTEASFDRWWNRVAPMVNEDPRFRSEGESIALRYDGISDPHARLQNPLVAPGRRLEIALASREALGEPEFRKQVLLSWRTGGSRVRDLALETLATASPAEVLDGLIGPGTESVEALIHAVRNAGWTPAEVGVDACGRLVDRVFEALTENSGKSPIDAEGRLAAALWRWGVAGMVPRLAAVAGTPRGQELVDAAFAGLPPRRAEALAVALLETLLAESAASASVAQAWLVRRMLDQAEDPPEVLAVRLDSGHAAVAERVRAEVEYRRSRRTDDLEERDMESEEGPRTAEITKEVFNGPVSIADLPSKLDRAFLPLGVSLARALARHHSAGKVVSPTRESVRLHPDGSVEIGTNGDPRQSPRPPGEMPSKASDVYASSILLIETLVGRIWPRSLSGDRAIPFLRHIAPDLPPSALAPLIAGLDPVASARVADGGQWLLKWQGATAAEERRGSLSLDPACRMRTGYDTHVGRMKILHTQTNQDALYVSTKGSLSLLVVCDGISTANTGSGDLAAGITTQVLASLWEQWLPRLVNNRPEDAHEFLDRALRTANQAVCEASLRLAGGKLDGRVPMGTTAVCAVGQGNHVSLAWLGDSRAYIVGPYGTGSLTADANQAGERMVDWQRGHTTTFDATGFALVRYVGHFDELGHAEPLGPLHAQLIMLENERLILCTDGITDYIGNSQAEVANVLASVLERDPEDGARMLVDAANRGGGGDNATVIIACPLT